MKSLFHLTFSSPHFALFYFLLTLSLLNVTTSCKFKELDKNPDTSSIAVQYEWIRTEQELWQSDSLLLVKKLFDLKLKHPAFYELYMKQIIAFRDSINPNSAQFVSNFKSFIQDSINQEIYNLSQTLYNDLSFLDPDLKASIQNLKYYFPESDIPDFYTLLSEFGVGSFVFTDEKGKDAIGIGLDFFLGQKINYSSLDPKNPSFSNYLTRCFNQDHLLRKIWEPWVEDKLSSPSGETGLDIMIHRGKKLYLLSKLCPMLPDTVLHEYTPTQLDWCKSSESAIWSFLLDQNFLYQNEPNKIRKYTDPAPRSQGMPEESPGRTAEYIGFQIVKSYMDKNSSMTMQDLLKNNNSQEILEQSKWKPKSN